jgi:hydroxymethylpyrimidine pyrophosphatase-like HAD family hydrolase/hypoxanthine phosphoribosyltransferase
VVPTNPPTGVPSSSANARATRSNSGELLVANLLLDFGETIALLRDQIEAGATNRSDETELVQDAFLLSAGAGQILDDYLHRDFLALGKLEELAAAHGKRRLASLFRRLLRVALAARSAGPRTRALIGHQRTLAELVEQLAGSVTRGEARLSESALRPARLLSAARAPRSLQRSVLRLPNCYRSFDQHPDDCRRLAELFAEREGDRARPLLVLGLRTSGSYLAPLTASHLRQLGFAQVGTLTLRPGQVWSRRERARPRATAARGGAVLLVDDPPQTGHHLRLAIEEVRALGVPADSIVLLQQALPAGLPASLQDLDLIQLPWESWSIHERLGAEAVRAAMVELGYDEIAELECVQRGDAGRGHVSAVFRMRTSARSARLSGELLYVRGVGLGYLGRQVLAVADPLSEFLPRIYGLRDGLLFREWLPEQRRLQAELVCSDTAVADRIAAYAAASSAALPIREDVSIRLVGRDALWQNVASMLSRAFGRLRLPLRPVLQRTAKRLVRAPCPAVAGGGMRLTSWFGAEEGKQPLRGASFEDGAFRASGLTLYNFDPVFDLATASIDCDKEGLEEFGDRLRERYEALTSEIVPGERWLLYRLLGLLLDYEEVACERAPGSSARLLVLERAMARIHRRYISELFFEGLEPPSNGALCALDVDGVLETRWLPYPALGPAGASALRSLNRHGFRPVLVTGRSLEEVRERCLAYRLTGGVAEYGAVLYDGRTDEALPLLGETERADLGSVRRALLETPDVLVHPNYENGVRASLAHELKGLGERQIENVLEQAGVGNRVRPIPGELQTDFMAVGVDKGTGLRALARKLGVETVALAVGDSSSDLPMLALAERPFAAGNADAAVRGSARSRSSRLRVTRAPYQEGLLTAVTSLVRHNPARCSTCRPPLPSRDAQLLLTVLAAHDAGKLRKLRRGLTLAMLVARRH